MKKPKAASAAPSVDPSWPAAAPEVWALASLIPYAGNAKQHGPAQVAEIVASIKEFGWTVPVLVAEDGTIIAGHGRVLAAQKLGLANVPVVVARGWSDVQRRAYTLADNRLAEAPWDEALLKIELGNLAADGFDLGLIGFSTEELAGILAGADETPADPEDVPPLEEGEPATRLGDVWLCGPHRIMCGDGTDAAAILTLAGRVPDIACSDPPYGISVVKGSTDGGAKPFGHVHGRGKSGFGKVGGGKPHAFAGNKGRVHGPAKNAIIQPGVYAPIIGDDTTDTAIASYLALVEMGVPVIALWGGNYFANALPPSRCWLVWDKENTGSFADAELAWTNQDKVVRLLRHQWSGLIKASERGEKRVHPTQKPVALAEWVIETLAPEAEMVLDQFLGSGWTLIACESMGKTCVGVELSPNYVDVAVRRWERFTGKQATRQNDGRAFTEVASDRGLAA